MPTITSIKPQKNARRANIYLDGKFGFGIDLENFVKLGLKTGQELSDREIGKIVKKAEFQKTFDKLLKFGILRPRSEKEISDWFKRKKVHPSLYQKSLKRLRRLELLDDRKFAEWWVEQRIQFKSKSKKDIKQELMKKGIGRETIEEVLAEVKIDEGRVARQLLEKKAYKWKNLNPREARQKISQYLAQKGFGWEVIKNLLKHYRPNNSK